MTYRTLSDLSNLVRLNIFKIPHDIDLVVGIPRSGMLPANMIALFLNKKLTDIDSFIEGRVFCSGERSKYITNAEIQKVLVVDDSVHSGKAMLGAKEKLKNVAIQYELLYLAPIVTTWGKQYVDIFFEVIDDIRIFEWNLFHHSILENSCVDIDGVINLDPVQDDDGPIYKSFLQNAMPLFTPTVKIGALVSCRLEKYRKETDCWLKRNNIRYNHLEMLPFSSKEERVTWGKHGKYKGEFYRNHDYSLFLESDSYQAQIIADIAQKPVICIESNKLVLPYTHVSFKKRCKRSIKKKFPSFYRLVKQLLQS